MPSYLIATDAGPRLTDSADGRVAWGLARGLLGRKHTVVILTLAQRDTAASVPGLARRLSKVQARVGEDCREMALFEGRSSTSDPQLLVVEAPADLDIGGRTQRALWLGAAARALATETKLQADAAIGWGEASALALNEVGAAAKFFILPEGTAREELSPPQAEAWGLAQDDDRALAALGAIAAHAVIAPSPAAAAALENHPTLANRASDEPIVAMRFGSDEPPFDPASDPALAAHFSGEDLKGKAQCRKALIRKLSLACGPRTLLLSVPKLTGDAQGKAIADALASSELPSLDVLALVPDSGDRQLIERVRILSIEFPTRVALVADADSADVQRQVLAAVDAALIDDRGDLTGRQAGASLRYGAVPIVTAESAAADQLVDLDEHSGTGNCVLYQTGAAASIRRALARLCATRQDPERWATLLETVVAGAPGWKQAADHLELIRAHTAEPVATGQLAPTA